MIIYFFNKCNKCYICNSELLLLPSCCTKKLKKIIIKYFAFEARELDPVLLAAGMSKAATPSFAFPCRFAKNILY